MRRRSSGRSWRIGSENGAKTSRSVTPMWENYEASQSFSISRRSNRALHMRGQYLYTLRWQTRNVDICSTAFSLLRSRRGEDKGREDAPPHNITAHSTNQKVQG